MNTIAQKAIIYCRVSSKTQLDGGGLGSQEQRCQEYAKSKGYDVITVFKDSYSGGGDFMKRPAMRELLEFVDENSEPYVVIFDDLKRFARDVKFHWELRAQFEIRNLTPECLNFTFDETPEGNFIETIIAAQGELERQQNKRQTIQKMKARLARGLFCFRSSPYGYRYIKSNVYGGKVLEIEPKDAEIIKEAFTAFATGKFHNIKDVAEYITAYKQKGKGQVVRYHTARNLLSNILYAGYLEYPKWHIPLTKAIHTPIISLEVYYKIQERLKAKVPQRSRKDFTSDFPLRGYINCALCNIPLTASWSKSRTGGKHPYYRCYFKTCIFKGKSVAKKKVHEHFLSYIENLTPKEETIPLAKIEILTEIVRREKLKYIDKQKRILLKDNIEIEIDGLVKMISTNTTSPLVGVYEEKLLKLRDQKILLESKLVETEPIDIEKFEPIVDKAFKPFEYPYFTWLNGTIEERKLIQNILFKVNIPYEKTEGFRTNQKTEILSLFEEIEAENAKKSCVRTKSKKVRTMITQNFANVIQELKRCAELSDKLDNVE